MKSGTMPRTDFTYEEFENLLASFYLTLLPLRDRNNTEDKADFETAVAILNGFAERHDLHKPEGAAKDPRSTKFDWGSAEGLQQLLGIA